MLRTQTANVRSMRVAERLGFAEVERFEEFGAEQWLGVRWPDSSESLVDMGSEPLDHCRWSACSTSSPMIR